jgi:predicted O-methyltransferase YrrM
MIGMSLSDESIETVYTMAVKYFDNAVFVELGCFFGASTIFLGKEIKKHKKNIVIHAIDRWTEQTWDERGEGVYDCFLLNIEKAGVDDLINVIKDTTHNASMAFKRQSVDFVYIDAGHDEKNIRQDINDWMPKLKQGGWIGGHDYQHDVEIVVNQYFKDSVERIGNSWLVK